MRHELEATELAPTSQRSESAASLCISRRVARRLDDQEERPRDDPSPMYFAPRSPWPGFIGYEPVDMLRFLDASSFFAKLQLHCSSIGERGASHVAQAQRRHGSGSSRQRFPMAFWHSGTARTATIRHLLHAVGKKVLQGYYRLPL